MRASNCVTLGIYFDQQLKAVAVIMFICVLRYLLCKKISEYLMLTQTLQLLFSETFIQTKAASSHGFPFSFHNTPQLWVNEISRDARDSSRAFRILPSFPDTASIKEEVVCPFKCDNSLTKCKKVLERHIYVYQMNGTPN